MHADSIHRRWRWPCCALVHSATCACAECSAGGRRREAGCRGQSARCSRSSADVNAPQADGMTALHWAAYHDDLNAVKRCSPPAPNRQGRQSLRRDAAVARLHQRQRGDRRTAARRRGRSECHASRRRNGADDRLAHGPTRRRCRRCSRAAPNVNARERKGQTALMWAAAEGHSEVVDALLKAGADFRTPLTSGFTPLFFAVREGRSEVALRLLEAGVDVNEAMRPDARQRQGNHSAAAGGRERPFRAGRSRC